MSIRDCIIVTMMILIGGWMYVNCIWTIIDLKYKEPKSRIRRDLKRLKDAVILFICITIAVLHI